MRRLTIALAALAAAVIALAPSCKRYSYESWEGDPTGARIYTLDNGLTVYAMVNKDQPRIDAQIAVRVGSKDDPRETTGLAHYLEHLMFKGTHQAGTMDYEAEKPLLDEIEALYEQYRQLEDPAERAAVYHIIDSVSLEASKLAIPNEYDKLMAAMGARGTNAYTNYDVTCYVENIPSNQLENWAKVQSDRFENFTIRLFHTELEAVYEEYNMYAAQDQTKAFNALFEGLFPGHPYNTDVIGLPQHLKNPSITNVKNYFNKWYVPNNMAVVLAGDFDPDKAIKIIDKYFGGMKPSEDLERPEYEPMAPIESPVVKTVLGNESPFVYMAWRFPGSNAPESIMLSLLSSVLYNGAAGLVDLDVVQQHKVLEMMAMAEGLADYSAFVMEGEPKAGQSLDDVCNIFLAELDKVKAGDFSDDLLEAIVNNVKLRFMQATESTGFLARTAVNNFINQESWEDNVVNYVERLGAITKEDLVAFANANFGDNYVRVNKIQKKDPSDFSIAKPQITPIHTNRDTTSAFLREIQEAAAAVKPIEPVFIDYDKDLSRFEAAGLPVMYKQNTSNGTFRLSFMLRQGGWADPVMPYAADFSEFLGTADKSAEEVKTAFYQLACRYSISCAGRKTWVNLSGLAENMVPALELLESVIAEAVPTPGAIDGMKANALQERANAKHDQRSNFARLQEYGQYGPKNPSTSELSTKAIKALTEEQLTSRIKSIFDTEHEVLYFGPLSEQELEQVLAEHHRKPETLAKANDVRPFQQLQTPEAEVWVAPFDANQLQLMAISNNGEHFDADKAPIASLYNNYFGSGMNGIVFQEIREARGLAYSAGASYQQPADLIGTTSFSYRIYTQNDKLLDALHAFKDIIEDMPVSPAAFDIAKESLLGNLRTQRTVKYQTLLSYLGACEKGLDYDLNKKVYEEASGLSLDDVAAFQQEQIKGRKYRVMILGRFSDIDFKALEEFGTVHKLSTEDIFGY